MRGVRRVSWHFQGRSRPRRAYLTGPTQPARMMRILGRMAQKFHTTIIAVTHDDKIIPTFKRIYRIRDGKTYE